jgi:hypothetical protein
MNEFTFVVPDDDAPDTTEDALAVEPRNEVLVSELSEEVRCHKCDKFIELSFLARSVLACYCMQDLFHQFIHCW